MCTPTLPYSCPMTDQSCSEESDNGSGSSDTNGDLSGSIRSEKSTDCSDGIVEHVHPLALHSVTVSVNSPVAVFAHMVVCQVTFVRVLGERVVDVESLAAEPVVLAVQHFLYVTHGLVKSVPSLARLVAVIHARKRDTSGLCHSLHSFTCCFSHLVIGRVWIGILKFLLIVVP